MSETNAVRRGTGMPGSDVAETNTIAAAAARGWVLSAFGGANATQVSNTAIAVFINGTLQRIVASGGTANALAGTVATNATGAYVITYAIGGTLSNALYAGATGEDVSDIAITLPASQLGLAMILVAATATAFNGGTNSLADGAYTVSVYNFTGPVGLAIATENFTTVPG